MATTEHDVLSWRGQNLMDSNDDKIGKIEEIYLDADSNAPEWALVTTGMFGTKQSFVPIEDATRRQRRRHQRPVREGDRQGRPEDRPRRQALRAGRSRPLPPLRPRGLDDVDDRASPAPAAPSPPASAVAGPGRQRPEHRRGDDRLRGRAARRHHRARSGPRAPEEVHRRGRGHQDRSGPPRRGPPRARADHRRQPRRRDGGPGDLRGGARGRAARRGGRRRQAGGPKERVRLEKDVTTEDETVSETVRQERVDVDDSRR